MTKYQRMHFIFIKQYMKQIMEYKIDFFCRRFRSIFNTRAKSFISECSFSTYPFFRRMDFSANSFYLWFFSPPKRN